MNDYKEVNLEVTRQGAPIVNHGLVYAGSIEAGIVALHVDLRTKYCIIISTGSDEGVPIIDVQATDRTPPTHLDPTKDCDSLTEIAFPEYRDWSFFSSDIGRYSMRITLVKNLEY